MKYFILIFLISILMLPQHSSSIPVGSGFNYQGELINNDVAVTGSYDILFKAFATQVGGAAYSIAPSFTDIEVINGIFNLNNVDFGDALFDGQEYWIEISVKENGTDNYSVLSPRQRIAAVPYAVQADFLSANGAKSGEVLQFDGTTWSPQSLDIPEQIWNNIGDDINFISGNIGIGTVPSSPLHVKTDKYSQVASFDGDTRMYMYFSENGAPRGYVGSYQTRADTNPQDFEIGTTLGSTGNMHIVTGSNDPRITVTADGKVGINNLVPEEDFHVAGNTLLEGEVTISGDVLQSDTSNGMMKYMVYAYCQFYDPPPFGDGSGPRLIRSHNGTTNKNEIEIEHGVATNSTCTINFPTDLSNRFWQVSSLGITTSGGSVGFDSHCKQGINANSLDCYLSDLITGDPLAFALDAKIMVLVY